jgi:hypothetical protein
LSFFNQNRRSRNHSILTQLQLRLILPENKPTANDRPPASFFAIFAVAWDKKGQFTGPFEPSLQLESCRPSLSESVANTAGSRKSQIH